MMLIELMSFDRCMAAHQSKHPQYIEWFIFHFIY